MNRESGHERAGSRRRVGADAARRSTRRNLLIALAGALTAPASFAQQQGKVRRIGFLGPATASGYASRVEALRAGLRDLGYVEGKNLAIEFRWAEERYERLPELAAELVRLKVEVIVTAATPAISAAKAATHTIPIVMATGGDVVGLGLVASLARPGGNVTGSTSVSPESLAKRLELLKEAFPRTRQVAVVLNPDNPGSAGPTLKAMEAAARSLKLELHQFGIKGSGDIDSAAAVMAKRPPDAILAADDAVIIANARAIANLAARMRLPSVGMSDFVEAGGLMAYGPDRRELFRRAAYFVDRILKGAKPGDLPVEQATRFELVLNLQTARFLGVQFPPSILARTDRVIE